MDEKQSSLEVDKKEQNQEDKKEKKSLSVLFKEYKAEFDKISWPNRQELTKQTISVIVTSLLFAIVIFVMDTIYRGGYEFIAKLFS